MHDVQDPVTPQDARPGPWRRAGALAVDVFIVAFLWSLIDDLVFFPFPRLGLDLGLVVAFWWYHSWGDTPGYRLLRLRVVAAADGRSAATAPRRVRALVVGVLLLLDWQLVVETVSAGHAPVLVAELIDSVRWCLLVTIGLLALIDPQNRTLHDRITGTQVIRASAEATGAGPARPVPRWVPIVAVLVVVVVNGARLVGPMMLGEADALAALGRPMREVHEKRRQMERVIGDELAVRTTVDWQASEVIAGEDVGERTLRVDVELPALAWFMARKEGIAPLIIESITLTPFSDLDLVIELRSLFAFFFFSARYELDASEIRAAQLDAYLADDAEAARLYGEVALRRSLAGEDPLALSDALWTLGAHLLDVGRPRLALPLYLEARDHVLATLGPDHSAAAEAEYNLGYILKNMGAWDAAASAYAAARRVLDTSPAAAAQTHVDLYLTAGEAELLVLRGELVVARERYNTLLDQAEARGDIGSEMVVKALVHIAMIDRHAGAEGAALASLERARAICEASPGLDASLVAWVDSVLAGEE